MRQTTAHIAAKQQIDNVYFFRPVIPSCTITCTICHPLLRLSSSWVPRGSAFLTSTHTFPTRSPRANQALHEFRPTSLTTLARPCSLELGRNERPVKMERRGERVSNGKRSHIYQATLMQQSHILEPSRFVEYQRLANSDKHTVSH